MNKSCYIFRNFKIKTVHVTHIESLLIISKQEIGSLIFIVNTIMIDMILTNKYVNLPTSFISKN